MLPMLSRSLWTVFRALEGNLRRLVGNDARRRSDTGSVACSETGPPVSAG